MSGFVVFPDNVTAAAEAAKLLENAKLVPEEAAKYLAAARLLQANGDLVSAIRGYGRAADLFRKRVETESQNGLACAGLAEALGAIGRGAEAQSQIEKALALAPGKTEIVLSALRVFQERAWQAFSGEQRLFSATPFLETVAEVVKNPPDALRLSETRRHLERASALLGKLTDGTEAVYLARSCFLSFRSVLNEALRQIQRAEQRPAELRKALFSREAIEVLEKAAGNSEDPTTIAAAAATLVLGESLSGEVESWSQASAESREEVRRFCTRMKQIAEANASLAAAAWEYLGCVQLIALRDYAGAQRSFRSAVEREGKRHRSWELAVLAAAQSGDSAEFFETCQARFDALPNARSSIFLAKAYERVGDASRAELVCVAALAAHPKDFYLNLSLAALLLKRDESGDYLWRVRDAISKAEKQVTGSEASQNALDLALIKSIYLALSDKPEEARAALSSFTAASPVPPEIMEVLRVLDR